MTTHELRIAKLSKILNSTWNEKISNPVIQEALGRAVNELQKTIKTEKDFNNENEERMKMQARIEKQEEFIKENIRKHHFIVLKKQIEDRKRQKDISEVEKLMERPRPQPRTPLEPPKFFFRERLKDQIKEKRQKVKESQKDELDQERFMIKLSKLSLEEDIKKKQQQKEQIYNDLKKSWENSKHVNKLKKEADRLKFFGNLSLSKDFKMTSELQRSKSKEKPNFTPIISKKKSKSLIPKSEKKIKARSDTDNRSPIKENYQLDKAIIPDKPIKTILNKEFIEGKSPSPSKQEIISRLEKIKQEEEKIQSTKKELIDYLNTRAKSKN